MGQGGFMRETIATHRLSSRVAFAAIVFVAFVAACAKAGGDVSGGDLTEAGVAATVAPVFVPPPLGCIQAEESADASAPNHVPSLFKDGTTWTDLYNDVFGAEAGVPGSCGFKGGSCHANPGDDGTKAGIHCFDKEDCYQSMMGVGNAPSFKPIPVVPGDVAKSDLVMTRMRHCLNPNAYATASNVVGDMPQQPTEFFYPQKTMDRVRAWIDAGAPNN